MSTFPDISAYLDHLARVGEPNTVKTYRLALAHFAAFLNERGIGLDAVNAKTIAAFVADQLARPYAPRTVQIRLVALRTFGVWAVEHGVWTESYAQGVPSVADTYTPTHVMSAGEVDRLVEEGPDPHCRTYLRDRALVLVAVRLGFKNGEIQRLTWESVDLEIELIHVDGGPRRDVRDCVLPGDLLNALAMHAPLGERVGSVFVGKGGRPMSDRSLRRVLTGMGERAGLLDVTFDAIRFAVVADSVRSGDPLGLGQEDFGYANASAVLRAAGRFAKEVPRGSTI